MITHLFLDFDGVFTDNFVYIDSYGVELVRCSRSDGIGLSKLKKAGIKPVIVSSEKNHVIDRRARKLGIDRCYGIGDKVAAMMDYCDDLSKAAFIGNDENDIPALSAVGYPVAVQDANFKVKKLAKHITKAKGGNGAVREICEHLIEAQSDRETETT